jgi:hypothetical protein
MQRLKFYKNLNYLNLMEAIQLCENIGIYLYLGIDTKIVPNSK